MSGADNPLGTDRWADFNRYGETGEVALEDAGYQRTRITNVAVDRGCLFTRALDGSRDFYVRMSATELKPADFYRLKLGQVLMVLPSSEPPEEGRAWPAKHAMLS